MRIRMRLLLSTLLTLALVLGLVPGTSLLAYADTMNFSDISVNQVIDLTSATSDLMLYNDMTNGQHDVLNATISDTAPDYPDDYTKVPEGESFSLPYGYVYEVLEADDYGSGFLYFTFKQIIPVTGVTLNPSTAQTINVDGQVSFTATVTPDNATDKTVKWGVGGTNLDAVTLYSDAACTAGNEVTLDAATEILTVYAKGISAGSATVTVTATNGTDDTTDDKSASCEVTVEEAATTHTHNDITFTAWTDELAAEQNGDGKTAANSLPATAGSYYLTADVTIGRTWQPSGDYDLCLNGHTITADVDGSPGIKLTNNVTNVTLNLYDDEANAGKITHAAGKAGIGVRVDNSTFNMHGGTITGNNAGGPYANGCGVFLNGGTFNMHGGIITGNSANNSTAGGVSVGSSLFGAQSTFNMYGGTITGNNTTGDGGGVKVVNGTFAVSGSPTITGNVKGGTYDGQSGVYVKGESGSVNNVYLNNDRVITVGGALTNATPIGVTMQTPGVFTSSTGDVKAKDYAANFTSDNDAYTVAADGNELKAAHTHDFTYAADGATITATCAADGCTLPPSTDGGSDHVATLTIAAPPHVTYGDGNDANATVTDANSIRSDATVQYQKKTGDSYGEATETAPTDAGTYKASITLGEATASVEYTIAKAANPATVASTASVPVGGKSIYLSDYVDLNDATGEVDFAFDGDARGCSLDGNKLASGDSTGVVIVNVTVAADDNHEALAVTRITVSITEAIFLSQRQAFLTKDETVALTASILPESAANKKVIWSVSDNSKVKLYTDADCNNEVGTGAVDSLTVYAKGKSLGNSDVTVTLSANSDVQAMCSVHARYGVTLSGGANAALELISDFGGSYKHAALETPGGVGYLLTDMSGIFTIVYTANSGYQFPETSDCYKNTSGVTVARASATQLRITGAPTADVSVTVPDAIHAHDFVYSASGATITATCGAAGCDLTANPTLTVAAPTLTTYGQTGAGISASATLTGLDAFNTATGLSVEDTDIRYYKATKGDGGAYAKGEEIATGAPTSAGDYLAEIALSGVKTSEGEDESVAASVGYTIAKADSTIATTPTAGEITYGQTLADSTLAGGQASVDGTFAWKDLATAPAVSDSQETEYDVVFTPTDGNYAAAECKAKLTVNKADSKVAKAPEPTNPTYSGKAQALVTAGTAEGGTMAYSLDGKEYSEAIPTGTDAKAYTVWYKVVGDANHNDSEPQKVTSTIAEKGKPTPKPTPAGDVVPTLSGHVQNVGDVAGEPSGRGARVGTEGRSLRLESFSLSLPKDVEGSVEYRAHVQNVGWDAWVADGAPCGTTSRSLRLEALQARLAGKLAKTHSVWYRVHAQNVGTMGWARDGQAAGTAGQSLRLESVEVQVLPRGEVPSDYAEGQASYVGAVSGSVHVQNQGWVGSGSGLEFGTTGQSRRLEAVRLGIGSQPVSGGIEYEVHAENRGWMPVAADGAIAGTTGQSRRLEAVRIRLTGEAAQEGNFSVWYRVHSQNQGWLGWAHDGEDAGTEGLSLRAEAIDVQVLPQGQVPRGYDGSAACVTR